MISFRLILMWIFCRSRRRTTSCSIRRYFPHRGSKSPSVAGIFISSNRFISENVEQGADKDVGGGEDPEVLQKVPQKEISAEGIKKEGFHFDDYCNLNLDDNDVEHYQRADTKERWKKHIEGEDYVPSPPSASSLTRSGRAPSKRFYENQSLDSS